ncbi:uncharacterized protein LOC121369129 [Gigantopelta aegis]|uniref:uncharacterized protein LOC121369129 n=1 Tax=Gigantopelta aegis TaxID=1735272 RepID=UPI001B887B48|nr:uncharacterized protein LOC121369129 [Gigantopelta aegis]
MAAAPVTVKTKRENIDDTKFQQGATISSEHSYLKKYVVWNPWRVAIKAVRPKNKSRNWRHRKNGIGYMNRGLYTPVKDTCSMFELGVMVPKSNKIYAVYYKITRRGFKNSIYSFMMKDTEVAKEVDLIVKRRGTIWIRRGFLNISGKLMFKIIREYVRTNYNYAWRSRDPKTGVHRFVKKGKGFLISGNVFLRTNSVTAPNAEPVTEEDHDPAEPQKESSSADENSRPPSENAFDANENAPAGVGNASSLRTANGNEINEYMTSSCPAWKDDRNVATLSGSHTTTESDYTADSIANSKEETMFIKPTYDVNANAPSTLNVDPPSGRASAVDTSSRTMAESDYSLYSAISTEEFAETVKDFDRNDNAPCNSGSTSSRKDRKVMTKKLSKPVTKSISKPARKIETAERDYSFCSTDSEGSVISENTAINRNENAPIRPASAKNEGKVIKKTRLKYAKNSKSKSTDQSTPPTSKDNEASVSPKEKVTSIKQTIGRKNNEQSTSVSQKKDAKVIKTITTKAAKKTTLKTITENGTLKTKDCESKEKTSCIDAPSKKDEKVNKKAKSKSATKKPKKYTDQRKTEEIV